MAVTEQGYIGSAELLLDTQPVEGNTVGIGADTYYFGTPPGSEIAVALGADAAGSRSNLVDAINGSGTASVKASVRANFVRVENADAPGGTPVDGTPPSTPLSAALAALSNKWNALNLNELGENYAKVVTGSRVLSAQNLLGDEYRVVLGITPGRGEVMVQKKVGFIKEQEWPFSFDGQDLVVKKQPTVAKLRVLRPGDTLKWTVYGN